MGFSDSGYLNAILLLVLAHIIACTQVFLFNMHNLKNIFFGFLSSAPNIRLHGKSRIYVYNNCHTAITTSLLTQVVVQPQVFGLVGFYCTHNECTCVYLCGILTAKYNTGTHINKNSETSYLVVQLH